MEKMKRQRHTKGVLHVETEHAIINIYAGLRDAKGRSVETVEIIPDAQRFAGEPGGDIDGYAQTRIVRDDVPEHPLPKVPGLRELRDEGRCIYGDTGNGNQLYLWHGRVWLLDRGQPPGRNVVELTGRHCGKCGEPLKGDGSCSECTATPARVTP